MKTKKEIVDNWLPRYTGMELDSFGKYIRLTNFSNYLNIFAKQAGVEVVGLDRPMPCATANGITMINFGMGSPNTATICDLLSAVGPEAVLFLGKCGGLKKKNSVGDLILPIAAIRGEGTSDDYMPPEVPALPAFELQKAISTTICDHGKDYWIGALLLVSDVPMTPDGVKTDASDAVATVNHAQMHVDLGIASLKQLIK